MFTENEKEFIKMLLEAELEEQNADLKFYQRNPQFKEFIPETEERISEIKVMIAKTNS